MNEAGTSMLRTRGLGLEIPGRVLLESLDWQIQRGETWALLGRNGSGKSTLLHTLAGVRPLQSGTIELPDQGLFHPAESLSRRTIARQMALLQQHTSYSFDATVLQMAMAGRHPHLGAWQQESARDFAIARQALKDMDLEGLEQRNVSSLSGGEARRLAFATMLVQETPLLLLDEPSNHLDIGHQIQIMRKLRSLVETGSAEKGRCAALVAIHDLNLAARYCSHVLMLFGDGRYLAGPLDEVLSSKQLSELYNYPIEQLLWDQGRCFLPG
ncbi:MAG: ABC transporter ATP-binding protein [Proteobacteria bacterium]|nr:ABC transporter ATP-binding protein [Pseudomonadota bacterium]